MNNDTQPARTSAPAASIAPSPNDGDPDLTPEQAMAEWVDGQLAQTVRDYLSREQTKAA